MGTDDRQDRLLTRAVKELGREEPPSGRACPAEVEMAAYLERRLAAEEVERLEAHLADCPGCRAALSAAREAMDQAGQALVPRDWIAAATALGGPFEEEALQAALPAAGPSPGRWRRLLTLPRLATAGLLVLVGLVSIYVLEEYPGRLARPPVQPAPVLKETLERGRDAADQSLLRPAAPEGQAESLEDKDRGAAGPAEEKRSLQAASRLEKREKARPAPAVPPAPGAGFLARQEPGRKLTLVSVAVEGALDRAEIRAALDRRAAAIQACAGEPPARGLDQGGRLVVEMVLNARGRLEPAAPQPGDPSQAAFEKCLSQALADLVLPAPADGGPARLVLTFRFGSG